MAEKEEAIFRSAEMALVQFYIPPRNFKRLCLHFRSIGACSIP